MANRIEGRVKRIVTDRSTGERKGFGFIHGDDGNEYFFHASACGPRGSFDLIQENQRVEFDATDGGDRGPRAENVATV